MLPLKITLNIVALFIVFVISFAYGQDRKLIPILNPNCTACLNDTTLVYVKAVGSKDTVHQIWDFTQGIPTIIFAIGDVNSSITIYWRRNTVSSFEMNNGISYSFAAAIDKLIQFDDLKDNGYIDPNCPQRSYSLKHLTWRRNATLLKENEVMLNMNGHFKNTRGSVNIKLDLLPYKDYAIQLPHLIHTANSTLVDVSLVNQTISEDYNSTRYAVHLLLVSTDDSTGTMAYAMRKSLDDEHTPGVFEIVEIITPESRAGSEGGFIEFRPVGYTQPERGVTTSTTAHITNFNKTQIPPHSILDKFYAHIDSNSLLVQDFIVSFGESGDGYYKQHNYTEWSFTIGYGTPPLESFSVFVVLIISIGLAVPVLLALSGVIFVVVRKYRQRNAPARFSDEE